jgi:hypothetical protein
LIEIATSFIKDMIANTKNTGKIFTYTDSNSENAIAFSVNKAICIKNAVTI